MCIESIIQSFNSLFKPKETYQGVKILPESFNKTNYNDALEFFQIIQKNQGHLAKWIKPNVTVSFRGNFTKNDSDFLDKAFKEFNRITETTKFSFVNGDADFNIHYVTTEAEYKAYREKYGFTYSEWDNHCYTFEYYGEIYKVVICLLPKNQDRKVMESITLHEMFHGFGFPHVFSEYNKLFSIVGSDIGKKPVGLSNADYLAYKMLYYKNIKAGCSYTEIKSYYDRVGLNVLL